MATRKGATKLTRLLGICVPTSKQNAAKIRIKTLDFDSHLLMLTRLITHKVLEVIYPLGDITDPITGKKVVAGKYREHIDEDARLFGKLDSAFDYDKAKERGSLEGIRDFTDKKTYIKFTDDPNRDEPYAIDPN
ncbi:mitochondrial ribosomal protein S17 isoform X2 [Nomia melanderi]|uniref:mitochondrial ribosomal protein S17 isoform X2 n=1 Tax=Nomia melanderi TaxID=2448451 RepID=UPI001304045C|nr:uncharacterized protein LOC116429114 isoform X2 [Nomia melanderi]